jgi:hypothetical protein
MEALELAIKRKQNGFDSGMRLQAALDSASQPDIRANGSLSLYTSADIGSQENPLGIFAAGGLTAVTGTQGSIYLESLSTLLLNRVSGNLVNIHTTAPILGNGAGDIITADHLILRSFDGDIGQSSNLLRVYVNALDALADNIYLYNSKTLTINQIIAMQPGGLIKLTVRGDIIAGEAQTGPQHIWTDNLIARVYGQVAARSNPLQVLIPDGGRFTLYLTGGHWYAIIGKRPHVVWFGGIVDIIDYQLPEPDLSRTIEEGGIGIPPGMDLGTYLRMLREWLDQIMLILGTLERTILSFYPGLPQRYFDKVESLYYLIHHTFDPDICNLLDFNTGTRLQTAACAEGTRLRATFATPFSQIPTRFRSFCVQVALRDEMGGEIRLSGESTLTFRIPSAAGRAVIIRQMNEDASFAESTVMADENGDITILVASLGTFQLLFDTSPIQAAYAGEGA